MKNWSSVVIIKMKIKKFLIVLGIFYLVSIVSALGTVDLNINDLEFSYGEDLEISLNVKNEHPKIGNFEVISLLGSENEDFLVRPITKVINIPANSEKTISLYSFKIDENFKKGNYNVGVDVYYNGQKIEIDSINFRIVEAIKEFNFKIKMCKDSSCSEESKIFLKNKKIYLDYASDISNPLITATLKYPSGKTEVIDLPYSFKASQIGTYELSITASKEGYKTVSVKEQFGVIKKQAEIKEVQKPDLGTYKNIKKVPKENPIALFFFWLIIVVLIILIIVVIYSLIKKKR